LIYSITNCLNFIITCILFYFLSIFSLSMYGFSWFPDTLTRLNLNDALFNMYHFLWVTALYLSPFYFAIWALFTYFLIRFNKPQILFISLLIYFLYVVELFDFVIFNWQVSIINTSFLQFNTLLVNNLNKIHPFIFYMGTFLVFNASFLSTSLQLKKTIFSPITKLNSLRTSLLLILIVSLTSLFLGSWWAVQEGTWGGWWNWDPSETFGLLFLMFTLLNFHTKFNLNLFYKIGIRNKALVYVLILTYFFIQLNFDLVSHNFGVKFFYFFNNKLFFYLIIFVTLYFLGWLSFRTISSFYPSTLLQPIKTELSNEVTWFKNLSVFYIQLLVLTALFTSFFILFNYFIWNFVNFNLFNSDLDRNINNVTFLLLLGLWTYSIDLVTITTFLFLSFTLNNFLYLFWYLSFQWNSFIVKLHQLLTLFFLINLLSYNNSFILWSVYTFTEDLFLSKSLFDTSVSNFTCDSVFVEKNTFYKTHFSEWFISWNFFLYANTPVTNTFLLTFSNSSLLNFYSLFSFSNTAFILIENNYAASLPTLTFVILAYFLKTKLSNKQVYYY
jgi:hypothetical protein